MNTGGLIGQLLQAGMARGAGSRVQAASQTQPGLGGLLGGLLGGGSGGGLGGLLGGGSSGGALGGMLGSERPSSGGGLGGHAEMAGGFLGQGRGMGRASPSMGGGLGGLVGSMLGGGRAGGAMGGAAMSVIGMIAMNALRNMGQPGSSAILGSPGIPGSSGINAPTRAPTEPVSIDDVPAPTEDTQKLLLIAMMSAAKADGHIDDTELNTIIGKLKESGADAQEREWVMRELGKPLNVDALVQDVASEDVAAQVYAASVLAITADTPQEVAYLDQLAIKLGIQPAVRSYIHQSLGLPLAGTS